MSAPAPNPRKRAAPAVDEEELRPAPRNPAAAAAAAAAVAAVEPEPEGAFQPRHLLQGGRTAHDYGRDIPHLIAEFAGMRTPLNRVNKQLHSATTRVRASDQVEGLPPISAIQAAEVRAAIRAKLEAMAAYKDSDNARVLLLDPWLARWNESNYRRRYLLPILVLPDLLAFNDPLLGMDGQWRARPKNLRYAALVAQESARFLAEHQQGDPARFQLWVDLVRAHPDATQAVKDCLNNALQTPGVQGNPVLLCMELDVRRLDCFNQRLGMRSDATWRALLVAEFEAWDKLERTLVRCVAGAYSGPVAAMLVVQLLAPNINNEHVIRWLNWAHYAPKDQAPLDPLDPLPLPNTAREEDQQRYLDSILEAEAERFGCTFGSYHTSIQFQRREFLQREFGHLPGFAAWRAKLDDITRH